MPAAAVRLALTRIAASGQTRGRALDDRRKCAHHGGMSRVYHEGHRSLQERFDTRTLADRIEERLVRDVIDESDKAFIEKMCMFFLATSDEQGRPQCSYKGGAPGFVRVVDERTMFPNCPRYIHRMQFVEQSPFVPDEGCETPVPDWKRRAWARDVLAASDPARKAEPKD